MGIASSKVGQEDNEDITTGSVPSTPILTPKHNKKPVDDILDPRSPSCNILRTPITSCSSPFTPESNNACDTFNINSPAIIKTIDDPRSPTLAFTRTPITAIEETNLLRKVHKKNLDNIKKVIGEMPSQIPPKLLESSPIKAKPFENRRKSFVGLLETNLDYVETDLDVIILNKSSCSSVKFISPKGNHKNELKSKFLEQNSSDEKKDVDDLVHDTCEEEDEGFIKQELVVEEKEEKNLENTIKNVCDNVEDIQICNENQSKVIDDEDGLIISPPESFTETEIKSEDVSQSVPEIAEEILQIVEFTPKKENVAVMTVQEFENKVNKLIYTEQEHIIESPKMKENGDNGRRTPLRTRNGNNGNMSKSKPRLRVSDKPRRSEYATSRIPVFKIKNGQCENTPPRKQLQNSARKTRRAQWDSDNTLII